MSNRPLEEEDFLDFIHVLGLYICHPLDFDPSKEETWVIQGYNPKWAQVYRDALEDLNNGTLTVGGNYPGS